MSEGIYKGPEDGKFGINHIFKQKDGEVVCLNSAGHLNYLLEEHAALGQLCNVYYDGKHMLTKGSFAGKEAHNFELEIDDSGVKMSEKPSEERLESKDLGLADISL